MNYLTIGITLFAVGIVILVVGVALLIISPHLWFETGGTVNTALESIAFVFGILLLLFGVVVSAGGGLTAAVGFTKNATPRPRP